MAGTSLSSLSVLPSPIPCKSGPPTRPTAENLHKNLSAKNFSLFSLHSFLDASLLWEDVFCGTHCSLRLALSSTKLDILEQIPRAVVGGEEGVAFAR